MARRLKPAPRRTRSARVAGPVLVVLMGLPGAGKSTLARSLERRLRYVRVDRDALRAALFPGRPVTSVQKRVANAAVWRAVAAALRERRSVIVDGMTFARAAQRRRARALARRLRARCVEVFLDCPVALARERIAVGGAHPATDRSPALVTRVARRFEPVSRRALRLDARQSRHELLRRVRQALQERLQPRPVAPEGAPAGASWPVALRPAPPARWP